TSLSDDILPTSAEVLYAHIAAHRQLLRSSGIEVTLGQGYPRIVSLRSSPKQESEQVSPSLAREGKSAQASAAEHHFASKVSDSPSPINRRSEQAAAKKVEAVLFAINDVQEQIRKRVKEFPIAPVRYRELSNAPKSASPSDASPRNPSADQNPVERRGSQSQVHEQVTKIEFAPGHESEPPGTESISEALITIRDMQEQIRKQGKNVSRTNLATDLSRRVPKPITTNKGGTCEAHIGEHVPNTFGMLEDKCERPVFENVAEALSGLIDMQKQIGTRYVDPGSIVQFVAEQMQQITKSAGVAIAVI